MPSPGVYVCQSLSSVRSRRCLSSHAGVSSPGRAPSRYASVHRGIPARRGTVQAWVARRSVLRSGAVLDTRGTSCLLWPWGRPLCGVAHGLGENPMWTAGEEAEPCTSAASNTALELTPKTPGVLAVSSPPALGATVVSCVAYIPYSQRSCCEARVPDTIISRYG
jgi:hypothetical protein